MSERSEGTSEFDPRFHPAFQPGYQASDVAASPAPCGATASAWHETPAREAAVPPLPRSETSALWTPTAGGGRAGGGREVDGRTGDAREVDGRTGERREGDRREVDQRGADRHRADQRGGDWSEDPRSEHPAHDHPAPDHPARELVRNRYLIAVWVASAVLVIGGASLIVQGYEQTMMQFSGFGGTPEDAVANARSYAITSSLVPLGGPLVALGLLGGLSTLMLFVVRTSQRR